MGRIGNFLYNLDRADESLIDDTSQETISSMVGRIKRGQVQVSPVRRILAVGLANWLDSPYFTWLWGKDHTARAIAHADALKAVDDGKEQ
jgi:hypothetical protein